MTDDRIAALSATPAPSDQDASQAQGEVRKAMYDILRRWNVGDFASRVCSAKGHGSLAADICEAELDAFGEDLIAALSPAPGATAQDGVEPVGALLICDQMGGRMWTCWPVPHLKKQHAEEIYGDRGGYRTVPLYATPTPTIPAGMVAWNGGDSAPDDWDGGPVHYANGITAQPLDHGDWQRPADIPLIGYTFKGPSDKIRAVTAEMRRFMPNSCGDWADKIDAMLAAAPTPQAPVGQEVERAVVRKALYDGLCWFGTLPEPQGDVPERYHRWDSLGELADRILASLNPTTGAGETEGGK